MRSALVLCLLALTFSIARADNSEARAHYEKGNAAYALGDYAAAATEYERAFQLKPDPALLYNAAQAHRVAGNKQRALLLYQNYLRVYGAQVQNRDEVQRHIDSCARRIESDRTRRPRRRRGPIGGQRARRAAPTPPPRRRAGDRRRRRDALVVTAPPRDERPLCKKPWFWVVTGGAALVVAGVAIGLGVGLERRQESVADARRGGGQLMRAALPSRLLALSPSLRRLRQDAQLQGEHRARPRRAAAPPTPPTRSRSTSPSAAARRRR